MILSAVPVAAAADRTGIRIEHAWARATTAQQSTASVYVTITSAANDILVGAATPAASIATLRQTLIKGGHVGRRPMDEGLSIGPHRTVAMHPGGYDILLVGLRAPLVAGATIGLALSFRASGIIEVDVPVLSADAADPSPSRPAARPPLPSSARLASATDSCRPSAKTHG